MFYFGMLLLLVLQYLRPQDFWGPLYGERVVFFLMMVLVPFWLLAVMGKKILRTPTDVFVALFCVTAIISNWSSFDRTLFSLTDVSKLLLCYMFVAHVVNSRRKLAGAAWMVVAMLVIIAFLGRQYPDQYASIGMFATRNDFGDAMLMIIAVATASILTGNLAWKVCGLAAIVPAIGGVIKCQGRGAQLASMFTAYAIVHTLVKSKRAKVVIMVIGSIALLAAMSLSARLGTVTTYQADQSAMGRVDFWAFALRMFTSSPLLGKGFGTFRDLCGRAAHSSYMNVLSDMGGIGLFLYVGLLFLALRDAYTIASKARNRTTRVLALAMTGFLAGHCADALFGDFSYRIYIFVQIALVSALRVIALQEEAASQGEYPFVAPAGEPTDLGGQSPLFATLVAGRPRLVTKRDLKIIGGLTFACWFSYKAFVMFSY